MARDIATFFDTIRGSLFGGELSASEVAGCEAVLAACAGWPLNWIAYSLATAYHETASTMQPVKEYGGKEYYTRLYDITGENPERAKRMGNTAPGDGAKYCGRGYAQITWKRNYQTFATLLNRDLVGKPDLAMQSDIAAQIIRIGMQDGLFTGKKLGNYLTAAKSDYEGARRVVNGTDNAKIIARYARIFEAALKAAQKPAEATPVAAISAPPQPDDPSVTESEAKAPRPSWIEVQVLRPLATFAVTLGLTWDQVLSADPKSLRTIGVLLILGIAAWAVTDQGQRWLRKRRA